MKLYDWIIDNVMVPKKGISEGLHVIGTCGECKYWNSSRETFPFKESCRHLSGCVYRTHKDFGCIHWEKKE